MLKKLVKNLLLARRQKRNSRQLDQCGSGAELRGTVEKRHQGGKIVVGSKARVDGYLVAETASSRISIGNNTLIGNGSIVDCADSITIGDNVLVSYECVIADSDNHSLNLSKRKDDLQRWRDGTHDWSDIAKKPVRIDDGAWIGARSIILKGVTIGRGAIVGMGSVVTKDVAPFTIVGGNPAQKIGEVAEKNA